MHSLETARATSSRVPGESRGRRKRLLYLAEAFPPTSLIGGVRAWNTVKQLSLLGWEVTVVTPFPHFWRRRENEAEVESALQRLGVARIETKPVLRFLTNGLFVQPKSRVLKLVQGLLRRAARTTGVDPDIGWAFSVLRRRKVIEAKGYDIILATGSPFISFRLARYLGRRLNCPFVLDYRDLWHGNPHAEGVENSSSEQLELKILRDARDVTVVSQSCAKLIANRAGFDAKIHVVTNGFDPEIYDNVKPAQFDHFAMVYAGSLYFPKRTLDPVLKALASYASGKRTAQRPMRLHYYGAFAKSVQEAARKFGCDSLVDIHAEVSREEALSVVKGASLSIVISSVLPSSGLSDDGIVTSKIFDCIGMQRPVLAIAPRQSDLRGVVAKAGMGACFEGDEVDAIAQFIGEVEAGRVPPVGSPNQFSWSRLGLEMDRILSTGIRE
jgi:glycosyltransferase involved in cell wall biosynthesis